MNSKRMNMKLMSKGIISIILIAQLSSCAVMDSDQVKLKETNYESTLRYPANEKPSCAQVLLTFYENQDEKRIKSRIKATKTLLKKFRKSSRKKQLLMKLQRKPK